MYFYRFSLKIWIVVGVVPLIAVYTCPPRYFGSGTEHISMYFWTSDGSVYIHVVTHLTILLDTVEGVSESPCRTSILKRRVYQLIITSIRTQIGSRRYGTGSGTVTVSNEMKIPSCESGTVRESP